MLFEGAYENIVAFLRGQVTDPITRTGQWIYPDYPREDTQMPRISVLHLGTSRTEIGLGDQGSRIFATFEIGIWTNSRISATINGDPKKGSELREYVGDEVTEAFINKRQYLLTTYGFLDCKLIGTTLVPYDPSTDLYNKRLMIELVWDVAKT